MGVVVLFPGGFKPPTAGHLDLAQRYANNSKVDRVEIIIGPSPRGSITREDSIAIWKILDKNPKINIISSNTESPLAAAYEYLFDLPKNATGTYTLASSSKGGDDVRVSQFIKNIEKYKSSITKDGKSVPKNIKVIDASKLGIDIKPIVYKGREDQYDGKGISASVLRKDLESKSLKKFATNYPGIDKNKIKQIYDILSQTEKPIADKIEEIAIFRTLLRQLITEGGAAGHMAHPFDIPNVKTGKDLINVFKQTAEFLSKNKVPVKIDGVNSSIRLANIGGKKQFVLDRGSNKPLDVKGVTSKDLEDRFGEGHGMIRIGGKVLQIFNEALPSIKKELTDLGMLNNPNVMMNIEYVEGKSNVQEYESNFLAIHNLLELERISPTKRATKEISYSKEAMSSLIKKVSDVAKKYDFEVVGEIPAEQKAKPNLSSALSKNYTVVLDANKKESKSLQQWLDGAKNTKGIKLKLKNGKVIDALSKQVFTWIRNGNSVSDLVADPKDAKIAIDSFAIYEATMQLGDAILNSLTSPIGDVKDQEGIVIRNTSVYDKPYKITGSFIIKGLESTFGK